MKKELITALATALTSTMVTIPAHAARPDMSSSQQPFDPNATAVPVGWSQEEANTSVGPIEEDSAIMDAFGGVERYRASYEIVTPEYFKSVYSEVAKSLQAQVDTTSRDTIMLSVATAVNNHFTKDFNAAHNAGLSYGYTTRIQTDYLAEGRIFSSFAPAVLIRTMLSANGISSELYGNYLDHNGGITVKTDDGHYISITLYRSGKMSNLVDTVAPAGMSDWTMSELDMGAYKDYLN